MFIVKKAKFIFKDRFSMLFLSNNRVVAVDQRGYGDSDKPNGVHNYTVATLVSDLRELVTTLGKYAPLHGALPFLNLKHFLIVYLRTIDFFFYFLQ